MPDDPQQTPEFGPSGYLPERASKRARKIVLRAPLGLQWGGRLATNDTSSIRTGPVVQLPGAADVYNANVCNVAGGSR
ncbi:hypothetical protein FTX61_14610 [Nitriliruptoraceae bacterium ZYF776]|nr:hypothetical protein [Profundirhabdus halotolerans]